MQVSKTIFHVHSIVQKFFLFQKQVNSTSHMNISSELSNFLQSDRKA